MIRCKFVYTGYSASMQDSYPHKKSDGSIDYTRPERVEHRSPQFRPVYGNGDPTHENTKFWEATPSGNLEFQTVKPEAWGAFELGREYYVDISPA